MRKKKWNWARSWGSTPGSLNFYGGQEARHECYLPSMLALGFAYTILASELETIHSKNKMKIRVSYFLLPQRQLNFQNLIIWLLYICYLLHFDPNVTKKKKPNIKVLSFTKLNNIMCSLSYFKCLWTGNEISVAVPS